MYEVKLERINNYKARPTTNDQNITVTPVDQQTEGASTPAQYKGFKHDLGTTNTINRMTVHGHIVNVGNLGTGGTIGNKRYVYVYFEISDANDKREKPLLICLQGSDDKTWYERTGTASTGYTWTPESGGGYDNINPSTNTISTDFAEKIGNIKTALNNPPDTKDTGYTKLDSVEIDISQTAGNGTNDKSYYFSGGKQITVTKVQVNKAPPDTSESDNWRCYKHFNTSGFKLGKITHSDVLMRGGSLNANMSMPIQEDGGIYVFYQGAGITQPRVICISKNGPTDFINNTWYKVQTASNWTNANESFGTKNPDSLEDTDLDEAAGSENINITPSPNYVIKLDKRPKLAGSASNIKYRTKDKVVEVERKDGSAAGPVPDGYTAYIHTPGGNITADNKIILQHNGNKLTDVTENQPVSKIFVYYKQPEDDKHKFPLIVCIKKNSGSPPQTYYKRGQTWSDASSPLNDVDPESNKAGRESGDLATALNGLKNKYEVKLEKDTATRYTANPNSGQITVTDVPGESGVNYKGYKHVITGKTVNRITVHGQVIPNIENLDSGTPITGKQYVYVYFSKNGDAKRERPLLICLQGSDDKAWYERQKKPEGSGENGYTWNHDSTSTFSSEEPEPISAGLASNLTTIKSKLIPPGDDTNDTGYPKLDSVEIDISQTAGASNSYYFSGGTKIQVEKKEVQNNGTPSTNWVGYKHSNAAGTEFTPKSVMHSDQEMTGGGLTADMRKEINTGGGIYVYYQGNNLHQPKVICISENGPEDATNNKWYTAGANESRWSFKSGGINGKKKISEVTADELDRAGAQDINITGNDYVIKLDKRPEGEGSTSTIKYRTGNIDVTVEETEGSSDPESKVPQGYVRYQHSPTSPITGTIIYKHNGFKLEGIPNNAQNVTAVYVYYRQSQDDEHHEFPLIVCVKISESDRTYYKRGNMWTNADINEDPDGATATTALQTPLNNLKDKYEIKLEKTNTPARYKGSPQSTGTSITVASDTTAITGFIGYSHSVNSGMTINRITFNGIPIRGILEFDESNTITIQPNNKLWVFYEVKDGTPKLDTPLLLYFKKGPTGSEKNHW